ncbi:MAG: alkyl sulfatase dimerization domain-containing protein [Gammaproteobacteria bacterium]
MKFFSIIIVLAIVTSCSKEVNDLSNIPQSSDLEGLINHTNEFNKEIYTYKTPGGLIHIAVGFGIANSIMIEGKDGNIVVDATDSVSEAEMVHSLFKKKNSNPIKAIIYTHNHGDHTFGAEYFIKSQEDKPIVIAHESTDYYVQRIMGIINPIISKRSTRMFGTLLPDDQFINAGIGPSLNVSDSPIGYIEPDTVFKDELKLKIAGINLELYHAPGETNDQIFVWLPDHKALMPGDNIYNTFPNLYTIRGTTHRNVIGWVKSLDHMRSFNPEYLFPSHTKPLSGEDVMSSLTIYRDAIQYVHDQTIRLMNEGYYPDEIVELIELPDELSSSTFLKEFYGTLRWSVKSIFSGYLGWFNGNPADLDPLSRKEKAIRISNLAGGDENLFNELKRAVKEEDMQWALQLSEHLINLEYKISETNKLKSKALFYEGIRSSNPNKRNYFLTVAMELDPSFKGFPEIVRSESLVNEINIDTIFSMLSVSLDPDNIFRDNYKACFKFENEKVRSITVRNSIAEISEDQNNCDLIIRTSEKSLKLSLAGIENPIGLIASGEIKVEGSEVNFLRFLSSFK